MVSEARLWPLSHGFESRWSPHILKCPSTLKLPEREEINMGWILAILILYVGAGILVEKVNRMGRGDKLTFKLEDWKLFLVWPKTVMGK